VGDCDIPNTPPARFERQHFVKAFFSRYFPNESGPAIVGRDDERIALAARLRFKIGDFSKDEPFNGNILQQMGTPSGGAMKAGAVGDVLAAVGSIASGRPLDAPFGKFSLSTLRILTRSAWRRVELEVLSDYRINKYAP
jgi:hypothetical protein